MTTTPPPNTATGPRIPGLDILEKVGEGGLSDVYRAVHLNLQRNVAVKVLKNADADAAGPGWLRESRLMAALSHPHIVTIHDAGQTEGLNYLVMEYVSGGSLRSRMRPGEPWPLNEAAAVLDRVARALEHIHAQGVLHLDLKPENILYAADGQIKITDFGLSVPHANATALQSGRPYQGTIDYAAPELRTGQPPDSRYDVFSLATLAYELLTGRLPGRVFVPPSLRNRRVPPAVDDVLRRGLARDPSDRFATVAEFRQAFAVACRSRRSRIPRWAWVVGGVSAALVAVLFAVHWWTPSPQPALERPTGLWVLYDHPDQLPSVEVEQGRPISSGAEAVAQRVLVRDPPQPMPAELPLPAWPTPLPVLVVRSPGAWGFVYPLRDRTLAQRVVNDWPTLLSTVVPPDKNVVKAGGFDGECLQTNHRGNLWRVGDVAEWDPDRRISPDPPADRPDNPALVLTNFDPSKAKSLLGCYQPLASAPPPGAAWVLRYRARSRVGKGSLAVYVGMPVAIPDGEAGPVATRIRRLGPPRQPEPGDPTPNRWVYRCPTWVTPTTDWKTYVVVTETPPFPVRELHRNLVIDLKETDQVWVDDVELFVWQPGNEP